MAQVEVGFNTESGTWFGTLNGETVIEGHGLYATYSHMRKIAILKEAIFVMRNKKGSITLQFKSFRGHNKRTVTKKLADLAIKQANGLYSNDGFLCWSA